MTDWMTNVPCRSAPDLFFSYNVDAQQSAADICRTECEHRAECRAQAIADGDIDRNGRAVRGGITPAMTPPVVKTKPKLPSLQPVAACGTQSGYHRHRRLGERSCVACLEANATAKREWKRAQRMAS